MGESRIRAFGGISPPRASNRSEVKVILREVDIFRACGYTVFILNACLARAEDLGIIRNREDNDEST